MVQYVCMKKARFGGEQYNAGNAVSAEKIAPNRVKQLIGYGVLTAVDVPDSDVKQVESADKPDVGSPAGKRGKK